MSGRTCDSQVNSKHLTPVGRRLASIRIRRRPDEPLRLGETMSSTAFPRTIEAITPAWLTQVLRNSGALGAAAVSGIACSSLGEGVGFMSAMQRLTLTYDGPAPGAPRSLVAKLAPLHPGAREIDKAFKFYERETGFYGAIGPTSPVRAPRAYHVEFEAESHDFILLLEDMAPARLGDQLAGLSVEDTTVAIRGVAGLHAQWWEKPALRDYPWLADIDGPAFRPLQPIYQQCWPALVDFLGDEMSPQLRTAGERFATRVDALLDVVGTVPRTVMHGDYRADHMFFDVGATAEPFAVADWQITSNGPSAFDLAYLMTGSLSVADRRRHQDDLLGLHHQILMDGGVSNYALKQAREEYRHCAMLAWCWPVIAVGSLDMANERGVAFFHIWCERAMTAITDLKAWDLIP